MSTCLLVYLCTNFPSLHRHTGENIDHRYSCNDQHDPDPPCQIDLLFVQPPACQRDQDDSQPGPHRIQNTKSKFICDLAEEIELYLWGICDEVTKEAFGIFLTAFADAITWVKAVLSEEHGQKMVKAGDERDGLETAK